MPTLGAIARAWGRIGIVGFGGPPAHIALLRELVVDRRRWLRPEQFEDGLAAVNLLPGPASTQLAIFTAWRTGGPAAAVVGGLAFIVPGLVLIVALAALFLGSPPDWIRGAGAGAGAAVAAVAIHAGLLLIRPAWSRAAPDIRWRFVVYTVLGGVSAATLGPWLVAVLVACGVVEVGWRGLGGGGLSISPHAALALVAASGGTMASLAWVAFKVGALSYGGGFVIIPLMQADAVERYGWMTDAEFLNAVAFGPGDAGTGRAHGRGGRVRRGGSSWRRASRHSSLSLRPSRSSSWARGRFDRFVANRDVRAFFDGAGPAAIGAILGSAVPLALALGEAWQWAVLAGAGLALLVLRRGVVVTLLVAGVVGALAVVLGAPLDA